MTHKNYPTSELSALTIDFHTSYEALVHALVPKAWNTYLAYAGNCSNLFYIGDELYTTFDVPPKNESEMSDYIMTLRPSQLIELSNLLS